MESLQHLSILFPTLRLPLLLLLPEIERGASASALPRSRWLQQLVRRVTFTRATRSFLGQWRVRQMVERQFPQYLWRGTYIMITRQHCVMAVGKQVLWEFIYVLIGYMQLKRVFLNDGAAYYYADNGIYNCDCDSQWNAMNGKNKTVFFYSLTKTTLALFQ